MSESLGILDSRKTVFKFKIKAYSYKKTRFRLWGCQKRAELEDKK